MARIIASCINDRSVIDRLITYEARRSSFFLTTDRLEESDETQAATRDAVAAQLGLRLHESTVPVTAYIEMVSAMREPRWRLVNREVSGGLVRVQAAEFGDLLRERIRVVIRARGLPKVPAGGLRPALARDRAADRDPPAADAPEPRARSTSRGTRPAWPR